MFIRELINTGLTAPDGARGPSSCIFSNPTGLGACDDVVGPSARIGVE
jgi:hypothetical protein